jgi:hypothetical protein
MLSVAHRVLANAKAAVPRLILGKLNVADSKIHLAPDLALGDFYRAGAAYFVKLAQPYSWTRNGPASSRNRLCRSTQIIPGANGEL